MKYIINPADIERESMAIIDQNLPQMAELPTGERAIVKRIIHTTGDFSIESLVKIHPQAVQSGLEAMRKGCKIYVDVNMALAGFSKKTMETHKIRAICNISHPEVVQEAVQTGQTRAMVAMQKAGPLTGDIVVIGNAPTALFVLCDLIETGRVNPALVIGTPVGFVGAKESKDLLVQINKVPYITVLGTRGGSTIAASIVNALLYML